MRPEELRCAKLLQSFLESRGHCVSYEDGPDPPDILMAVDREEWGVEHTSLHQYINGLTADLSRDEMPRAAITSQAFRMEDRLRRKTDGKRRASWSRILQMEFEADSW